MFILKIRGTRERSPPLPKIVRPSLPRLGRSHASAQQSARHGPPHGGTAYLITVSSTPGKLLCASEVESFIPQCHWPLLWVYSSARYFLSIQIFIPLLSSLQKPYHSVKLLLKLVKQIVLIFLNWIFLYYK